VCRADRLDEEETLMSRPGSIGRLVAAGAAASLLITACSSPGQSSSESTTPATSAAGSGPAGSGPAGSGAAATGEPIKVGVVTSLSGPLQSYGQIYLDAFNVCLSYATEGTGAVNGRPVEVATADDAGDPTKATAAATDFIGKDYKILAGSASSGVATQVAPLAAENQVLFISGPAATDALTGINKYTFRSGRQSYQDVTTAASFLPDLQGKKVTVFAPDTAFGQANVAAVTTVFGAGGATVSPLLVPATATDLVPFAKQAADADADLLFVAWAGTNATQMWDALNQQGAFDSSTVVTGLDVKATQTAFAPVADKLSLLAHYFDGATDNDVEKALVAGLAATGKTQDLFSPDGCNAALMVAHAAETSPDDVDGMVAALEGYKFDGPKGAMEIRAQDHAVLQPMFQAKLVDTNGTVTPELVKTLTPDETAPPVTPFK
jgi:branched-chain amino acid transport system substrate-binding protein